jgi:hypothetical protein
MKNRREFLKTTIAAAGLSLSTLGPLSAMEVTEVSKKKKTVGPTRSGITWRRNIFCQFEHEELKAAIERCAFDTDNTIFYGTPGDPDIHACPAFVMIVDRNAVGHDLWREYVEFADLNDDDIPCFIVDNIKDLPYPKKKYVYQFDLNNQGTIPTIVKTITQMKKEMDRRLPDLLKNSAVVSLPNEK